jgi:hypothetical protein
LRAGRKLLVPDDKALVTGASRRRNALAGARTRQTVVRGFWLSWLALVLAGGQLASSRHDLSHLSHALAVAESSHRVDHDSEPTLDHPRDQCVAFHAIDSAAASRVLPMAHAAQSKTGVVARRLPLLAAEAPVYSSRAPPGPLAVS